MMSNDKGNAIQEIAKDVVRRLGLDEEPAASRTGAAAETGAAEGTVVIAPAYVPNAGRIGEYLQGRFGRYLLVGVKAAETSVGRAALTLDGESEARVAERVDACATLVLVTPRVRQLENIAACMDEGPLEYIATAALMRGIEILVLLDMAAGERKNGAFQKKMEQIIRQLRDMGVIVVERVSGQAADAGRGEEKALVSEAEVLLASGRNEKELVIAENTIVTPLAWDTAKELGIAIQVK